jgi:hypothetical protein
MRFALSKGRQHIQKQELFVVGVAEAPPGLQAGWSDCTYVFLFIRLLHLLIWKFRVSFCTDEGTVPFQSSVHMPRHGEVGPSFVALGPLEPQTARH